MDWLKAHTDLSQTTANNLMNLHTGVQETPFLAEMKQSAAVMLLALSPAQREKYAAEHDVQAMSVRQLREDMERLQQEAADTRDALAKAQAAHRENLERITADAEAAIASKAQEATNAQRVANNANGLYEKLNDQYAEAQERIASLERSLADTPTTITTLEVERIVEVLPPDYEQLQADLREANETADRMEADLRKARADLLRESAQEKGDSGGLAGFKQAAADFLARGYLLTTLGVSTGLADEGERGEHLRCIQAVEELCTKARKAIQGAPLTYPAADAHVE
jgi:chromosome segregation ATPase